MIVALHGFLGRGADWDFLRDAGFAVESPDLLASMPLPRLDALAGDTLIGYSMGGRLALHALLAGASFRRAVFISAGLGIEGDEARAKRRAADDAWARQFESANWRDVVRDWNAQPVLAGSEPERNERDYDRAALAAALREWSPALLPPVADRVEELTIPTLWIAGERDMKYVIEASRGASLAPRGELWVAARAGHRVPWDARDALVARLRAFID